MGPSITIESNNLNPFPSGNTYPLQVQTCLIFPSRWASFPIKISYNAQWEHLFSMYFDDFLTISLIILVYKSILDEKMISQWKHHSTSIDLFYFDDNFRRIVLWVLAIGPKSSRFTASCLGRGCFCLRQVASISKIIRKLLQVHRKDI